MTPALAVLGLLMTRRVRVGQVPLSAYAKDKYVAPEMSKFTAASIRDMTATSVEQEHSVLNFVLNTMLRVDVQEQTQRVLFNFLRRVESAFHEHALARDRTLRYVENTDVVSNYLAAINHWEVFLSHGYQAYTLLDGGRRNLFTRGDGSILHRWNDLYGKAKHAEKAYGSGQIAENGTMVVWLANSGLRSTESWLTFDEMAECLSELAAWSDAAQDPLTMKEKIQRYYSGDSDREK